MKKHRHQPYQKPKESDIKTDISSEDIPPSQSAEHIQSKYPIETDYPIFPFEEKFEDGKHYSLALVASRNSGKTYFIKHIFPLLRKKYDFIVVFSNSLQAAIYNDNFFTEEEEKFLFDEYNPGVLKDLERLQKHTKNGFDICVIFDDCVSMKQKHSDQLTQMYTRGRNMNMTIIFSTQSPMFIDSDSRGNIDFLFILKVRTPNMKEKVINHFLRHTVPLPEALSRNSTNTPKKSEADRYYQSWLFENTQDHNIVIIDYLNDDQIYKYKAP